MQDLVIISVFVVMLLAPCLLAWRGGRTREEAASLGAKPLRSFRARG